MTNEDTEDRDRRARESATTNTLLWLRVKVWEKRREARVGFASEPSRFGADRAFEQILDVIGIALHTTAELGAADEAVGVTELALRGALSEAVGALKRANAAVEYALSVCKAGE